MRFGGKLSWPRFFEFSTYSVPLFTHSAMVGENWWQYKLYRFGWCLTLCFIIWAKPRLYWVFNNFSYILFMKGLSFVFQLLISIRFVSYNRLDPKNQPQPWFQNCKYWGNWECGNGIDYFHPTFHGQKISPKKNSWKKNSPKQFSWKKFSWNFFSQKQIYRKQISRKKFPQKKMSQKKFPETNFPEKKILEKKFLTKNSVGPEGPHCLQPKAAGLSRS